MINLGFSTANLLYRRVSHSAADDRVIGVRRMAKQVPLLETFFSSSYRVDRTSGTNSLSVSFLSCWGVQGQMVVRRCRRSNGDFRGRIFSVVLRTVDVRPVGCCGEGTKSDRQSQGKIIAVSLSVIF